MMPHPQHDPRGPGRTQGAMPPWRVGRPLCRVGGGRALVTCALALLMLALAGCAGSGVRGVDDEHSIARQVVLPTMEDPAAFDQGPIDLGGQQPAPVEPVEPELDRGSGDFINKALARKPTHAGEAPAGQVTFNFEAQPIQAVVKAILGDLLHKNYIIAPGVNGKVSYTTAQPVRVEDAMPILETLLGWTNNTLIFKNGRYTVLPIKQAIPGNLVPRLAPAQVAKGYEVRIFPLDYIAPEAMQKLLKPFAPADAFVSVDQARSLMIMAGTPSELANYQRTIRTFDVNWLDGMSVGVFTLQNQAVADVLTQLEEIFGSKGKSPLAGLFRFIPIETTNSVIIITPQPDYLGTVREWLARLDVGAAGSAAGQRLYIYNVINMDATDLAGYLNEIFNGIAMASSSDDEGGKVAPGLTPAESGSKRRTKSRPTFPTSGEGPRITAVEQNNQLLVLATPVQWETIKLAAKRLDIQPLQVQIEAKVLEVQLSGKFEFGVQWFLEGLINGSTSPTTDADGKGTAVTVRNQQAWALGDASITLGSTDTFFYSFLNSDLQVALHAMQSSGNTKILSAPSVVVTNNQQATIRVGKEIPVVQTFFRPGYGGNNGNDGVGNNYNSGAVNFRKTGIKLEVTPRVNPGGLVYMEIHQEVSSPGAKVGPSGNLAINERTLETKIAVQSGQTVLLGGLIQQNDIEAESGVPLLSKIPFLGRLFGSTSHDQSRTELLILITPRVISGSQEAARITREYQSRFESLEPLRAKLEQQGQDATDPQSTSGETP